MGFRRQSLLTEILGSCRSFGKTYSRYWGKLHFSTTFHPQSDGQSERVIQILEDMLRSCVLDFSEGWFLYMPLVEFAYNNNY